VTVRNSPSWTIHSLFSRNLRFYGLNIENPRSSPNTDGLNPECSENVEIVGTRISVGDDCVAIKSGKSYWGKLLKRPSRNIRIRRCLMEYGQGAVVIGSEMACGVYDVEASYCLFRNTDRGLRIKTRRGRGKNGVIANIYMHHITMENVPDPLVINCFYNPDPDAINHYSQIRYALPVDDRTPTVRDIRLEKINATGALHTACFILGLPEQPIIGLVMRDIHVSFLSMVQPAPPAVANEIPLLAKAGFVMANVTDPLIENVTADGVVGPQFRILEDLNND
jgi:polygalacturonase